MPPSSVRRALIASLIAAPFSTLAADAARPMRVRTGTVATPDGELYYEVHGEGPPLVLVAGGPGAPRTSLMPEFDRLATRRSLVYFDNIGRGRSSTLPAGKRHSPDRDADDIEALRRALGHERIELLGHSYGGYAALAYAARHPERLKRLVISSSGYDFRTWQRNIDNVNRFVRDQYPEVWARLEAMRASGMKSCEKPYQDLYGEPIGQLYWRDPAKAKLRQRVSQDPRDTFRPEVYCDMIGEDAEWTVGGAMARFDPRAGLAQVKAPTLLTAGRHDIICPPRNAHELATLFPPGVARVQVFDDSSHRPWVEEGDRFFAVLGAFLDAE